ncbi:hypothetical protein BCM20_002624 [Clostridium beijerinckii]|uniref:hypothetical protein n=1 Tax=Clostridium beijerinckii TaxID=1520 RepID=UPI00149476CB|nr:hypothetical protein [Clostridium beijerinckii]NOW04190.1 hypothetical protein [Clostridium beijerinckii]NYC02669.1 hypothetical protein [Clostridium beijerinckii]
MKKSSYAAIGIIIYKFLRILESLIGNITNSIEIKNTLTSTKDLFDNRRTPLPNGATPAIDGETPNIKRNYTLRSSTIRKINEGVYFLNIN